MKAKLKSQIANSFEEAKALCKQLADKDLEHTMQQQGERFFVYWAQVEDTNVSSADFTLFDEAVGDAITGQIDVKGNLGMSLSFEGYGDCCSDDLSGSPVYIEKYDGMYLSGSMGISIVKSQLTTLT
jgi:hypothetical protein